MITICVLYALFFFPNQRKVFILRGYMLPQIVEAYFPEDGRIKERLVEDKAVVRRGEKLIEVEVPALEYKLKEATENIGLLEEKLRYKKKELEVLGPFYATEDNILNIETKELETDLKKENDTLDYLKGTEERARFISSDIAGIVVFDEERISFGMPARKGESAFAVVNPDKWHLYFSPKEEDLRKLKKGQRIKMYFLHDTLKQASSLAAVIDDISTSVFTDFAKDANLPAGKAGKHNLNHFIRISTKTNESFIEEYKFCDTFPNGFEVECKVFEK